MRPTVYIETNIPSYYVPRESRNIIQVARQQLTREWWNSGPPPTAFLPRFNIHHSEFNITRYPLPATHYSSP